jgi:predicted GNAT family acetyltransferase
VLWEDGGEPVSLAGWGGPTPNGIRVGPVYTPPELRGRGYGTAVTAETSRRLLDGRLSVAGSAGGQAAGARPANRAAGGGAGGRRSFCFLYTDLANPTSNAIYERIGYRRIAESAEIAFG